MIRSTFTLSIVLSAAFALALPCVGTGQNLEITPFASYRIGGSLNDFAFGQRLNFEDSASFGIAVDIPLGERMFVELMFSHQETKLEFGSFFHAPLQERVEVDIDYWHAGWGWQWNLGNEGRIKPFVIASLGLTELDPQSLGESAESKFSTSGGGGVKLMLNDHVGLRFEVRGFTTFVDSDDEIFCGSSNCFRYSDASILWQVEHRVGLTLAF